MRALLIFGHDSGKSRLHSSQTSSISSLVSPSEKHPSRWTISFRFASMVLRGIDAAASCDVAGWPALALAVMCLLLGGSERESQRRNYAVGIRKPGKKREGLGPSERSSPLLERRHAHALG